MEGFDIKSFLASCQHYTEEGKRQLKAKAIALQTPQK